VSADSSVKAPAAKQRLIRRLAFDAEPINITNLRAKGASVQLSKLFAGDDEWLKGLRFDVENKTLQSIAFLKVHVLLYGVKGYDNPLSIPLQWGEPPVLKGAQVVREPQNPLAPGRKVELVVTEELYARIRDVVNKQDAMANISEVRLLTSSVIFKDGTVWKGGSVLYPDEARAGVWREGKTDAAKSSSYLNNVAAYGHAASAVKPNPVWCEGCQRVTGGFLIECCSGECYVTPERATFGPGPGCVSRQAVTILCQPCSYQTCLTQEAIPCYGNPEG
jgi:hypothetical protein